MYQKNVYSLVYKFFMLGIYVVCTNSNLARIGDNSTYLIIHMGSLV